MDLEKRISEIREEFAADLGAISLAKEIEALKVKYLGKKGGVSALMLLLKEAPVETRPQLGKRVNDLKNAIASAIEIEFAKLEKAELDVRLESETLDVTLPGRRQFSGGRHVVLQMLDEAVAILIGMGFSVQLGPDIDTDYYNFEALNFAKDHPARDMHDTFYITSDVLLRTQTSNTQVRVMEKQAPPLRVVAPGKCYRNEDVSARSHVVFHQIEGLYVEKNVSFADLFATLEEFYTKLFRREIEIRFRPSYFPFVEPGMEVDINCIVCDSKKGAIKGCSICKHTGWLEVAGAGMVHPEVLRNGGIDPEEYNGYAFGCGIERMALLRHGIHDIRLCLEDDFRFLKQF